MEEKYLQEWLIVSGPCSANMSWLSYLSQGPRLRVMQTSMETVSYGMQETFNVLSELVFFYKAP